MLHYAAVQFSNRSLIVKKIAEKSNLCYAKLKLQRKKKQEVRPIRYVNIVPKIIHQHQTIVEYILENGINAVICSIQIKIPWKAFLTAVREVFLLF